MDSGADGEASAVAGAGTEAGSMEDTAVAADSMGVTAAEEGRGAGAGGGEAGDLRPGTWAADPGAEEDSAAGDIATRPTRHGAATAGARTGGTMTTGAATTAAGQCGAETTTAGAAVGAGTTTRCTPGDRRQRGRTMEAMVGVRVDTEVTVEARQGAAIPVVYLYIQCLVNSYVIL